VFRQDQSGYPTGGFIPHQRLSRKEALLGMTLWAAYAQFEENEKGSIEVGKWADFVVSSTNLISCAPEDILKMPIEQTIVHGETVFKLSE
jgi:predicted amidohydrolase YtcJ